MRKIISKLIINNHLYLEKYYRVKIRHLLVRNN